MGGIEQTTYPPYVLAGTTWHGGVGDPYFSLPPDSFMTYQLQLLASPRSKQERRKGNLEKSTDLLLSKNGRMPSGTKRCFKLTLSLVSAFMGSLETCSWATTNVTLSGAESLLHQAPLNPSRRSPQLGSTGQYSSQGLHSWTLESCPLPDLPSEGGVSSSPCNSGPAGTATLGCLGLHQAPRHSAL